MLRTGQRPAPPQSLIPTTFLENMGRDLVRLCDGMERHGLVDYEMGVWEEEIISRMLLYFPLFFPLEGLSPGLLLVEARLTGGE